MIEFINKKKRKENDCEAMNILTLYFVLPIF